jgi:2-polyprenyl-3-methyl-5-hydroxy-6-metoxy-1,4-benzoquinol methylase
MIGGNVDKKRLILKTYQGEQNLLEIGCSVGNTADAFRSNQYIRYQGVDIDCKAVAVAQRRFRRHPNFAFTCRSLAQFSQGTSDKFHLIYFTGILHHGLMPKCSLFCKSATPLLENDARLMIIEPSAAKCKLYSSMKWYQTQRNKGSTFAQAQHWSKLLIQRRG